jgi:hypothetical protein
MAQALSDTTKAPSTAGAEIPNASAVTTARPAVLQGFLAWLPAVVILVGMPLLALAATKYVVLPTVKQVYAQEALVTGASGAGQDGGTLYMERISLTAKGAHSGLRSLALIGGDSGFKAKIGQNKAILTTLAASDLRGKTVSDLEKPGVLDATRAQLVADFNQALGGPVVKEIYIAVWPQP